MAAPEVIGIFNVSTGQGRAIRGSLRCWCERTLVWALILACKWSRSVADDVPRWCRIPSKTIEELGWKPKVDFRTTMHRVLTWYECSRGERCS